MITIELEITSSSKPGQRNQISLRVLNNIDVFGTGGVYERMLIYARTPMQVLAGTHRA